MISVALKAGVSSLVVGPVIVGGYAIYKSIPKTVKEQLVKEGLNPLDTKELSSDNYTSSPDYSSWQKIIQKEKSDTDWKTFSGYSESTDGSDERSKINKLKKQCEIKLEEQKGSNNFDKILEETKKYCVEVDSNN